VATLVALAAVAALDAILPRGADALLHIFFADGAWFFVGKWEAKKKEKEKEKRKKIAPESAQQKRQRPSPPHKKNGGQKNGRSLR
jgi:hypothetical protein